MIKGKLKMTNFIDALAQQANFSTTENGAITHATSTSNCTDFFATGGALRSRDDKDALEVFTRAFSENRTIAVRLAFMFRDIRGGQGQRKPFRAQLKWLADTYPKETRNILHFVAEYGRWDDLYALIDTSLKADVLNLLHDQIAEDLRNKEAGLPVSLLGKWLKRINTSSNESVRIAQITRKHFGWTEKTYRKTCSELNEYLNVVENKMTSNRWGEIEYDKVPGQCLMKSRKAFARHDETRYQQFVELAQAGEIKVNAKTLYPYQVVSKILGGRNAISVAEAEMYWKNLANFSVDPNAIVVADVSGSMTGMPMDVCISLALYFSERAKGPYYNKFITFSKKPTLQEVKGDNIVDRVNSLHNAAWDMNTDLAAVFQLVLDTAVNHKIAQDDMVKTLYIISDMEFDSCVGNGTESRIETFYQMMQGRFALAGYTIPKLVFWNVDARTSNNFPVMKNTPNTCMISGFSPSVLQYLDAGELPTTEEMMMTVVTSERYNKIQF